MIYDRVLIRYGEMSTKGRNRNVFVTKLKKNIKDIMKNEGNIQIQAGRDRMYLLLNGASYVRIKERLSNVFGIQSFSPVVRTEKNIDKVKEAALALVQANFSPGNTFKINARRSDKTFEIDSQEMNSVLGGHILKKIDGIKVDVKHPDIELLVEVRKEGVFLSCEWVKGAGGLPAGVSGKAILLLSGGIDSPVAGYMMMKRGVEIEAVHFFSPPYTSERAKQKVIDLAKKLTSFGGTMKLHIVPFTEIQQKIHETVPANYTMTSTRRLMLTIADEIRKKNGGLALVTGESLGQVASQTMESMLAINAVTQTPVLRPLIAMDKLEIIEISQKIGTHDISILPYEDCCTIFTPPSPKTKPKLERIEHYESFFDFDPYVREAVEKTETLLISEEFESKEFQYLF